MGLLAGYFRGITEELIMRVVDVMLSFPSQIMVFAVVALLGINVQNVILANVFIKWAWYARMIRTGVMQYRDRNFVQFSRCVGTPERFILFRHLVPSIAADLAVPALRASCAVCCGMATPSRPASRWLMWPPGGRNWKTAFSSPIRRAASREVCWS